VAVRCWSRKTVSRRIIVRRLGRKGCDSDNIAGSHCTKDVYNARCPIMQYYLNYICTDRLYTGAGFGINIKTGEKPSHNSKCHHSNLRSIG
jgi:hypothetical protein